MIYSRLKMIRQCSLSSIERIGEFDDELLDVVDAVEGLLTQQGQQAAVDRLGDIRQALTTVLS